ncbi:hypothetical protein BJV74DRAFT_180662 [Russula compacta]|nr:hypothetical protein BJV74DRAFT_180662 [Russula compacta]
MDNPAQASHRTILEHHVIHLQSSAGIPVTLAPAGAPRLWSISPPLVFRGPRKYGTLHVWERGYVGLTIHPPSTKHEVPLSVVSTNESWYRTLMQSNNELVPERTTRAVAWISTSCSAIPDTSTRIQEPAYNLTPFDRYIGGSFRSKQGTMGLGLL